jgi:hypothetical protein
MKVLIALVALVVATPAVAQTVVCPYGQTCNGAPAVPFPVINPLQGLNALTAPLRQNQTPSQQQPVYGTVPMPTPPPVMPATRP